MSTESKQDFFMVARDSQFVVNFVVTNAGDDIAVGAYTQAATADGVTIHSSDSISIPDVAPGNTIPISYVISLDSVANPISFYQTTMFDVSAHTSNGMGGQASVVCAAVTYVCADINSDGAGPDIADIVYLIDYMFTGGPAPIVMISADVNGIDGGPDISDLVYLIDYMFRGGPPPAQCP